MVGHALLLAIVTGLGGYLVLSQAPSRVRDWLLEHKLFTRVVAAVGTYSLLGGSLVALFAAGFLDLGIGIIMMILADPEAAAALKSLMAYLNYLKNQLVTFISQAVKGLANLQTSTQEE